jgi:GNAT superfamily N-acetyltransferase
VIAIRRATDADRVAIARLHEATIRGHGPAAYTAEEVDSWAARILPANYPLDQQIYVAVDDDAVIAFGHYNDGEIAAVYVDPLHVRRGIGRLMMAKLEDVARAEGAASVHLNAALISQGFYEACGYRRTMETTYRTRGGLAIRVAVMEKSL